MVDLVLLDQCVDLLLVELQVECAQAGAELYEN